MKRLEAEEALRQSEERTRAIVNTALDGIIVIDERGIIESINPSAARIFGFGVEEIIGQSISILMSEPDRSRHDGYIQRYMATGEKKIIGIGREVVGQRKDGSLFPMDLAISEMRLGSRRMFTGIIRDITERKAAEEAAAQIARQQAAVARLGQRALAGKDLESLLDETVRQVADILEVEYCKVLELLPDGESLLLKAGVGWEKGLVGSATVGADSDSQAGYTLLSRTPVVVEDLLTELRFTGPALLHNHKVISGMSVLIQGLNDPYGVLGAHTTQKRTFSKDDVNFLQAVANMLGTAIERKKSEEALRQSEERLRLALEVGRMGTWEWNMAAGEVKWSPSLEAIHGLAPGTFDGTFEAYQSDIYPEDRDAVFASIRRSLLEGVDQGIEYRIVRPDGSVRWLGAKGRIFSDETGRPARMIGVCSDITERKGSEEALQESHRILDALMEYVPEGITIADEPENVIRLISQHGADLVGYPRFAFEGVSGEEYHRIWRLYHPDSDIPAGHDEIPIARAVKKGETITNEEWLLAQAGGERIPILCNAGPIRDRLGQIIGGVLAWRDIRSIKETRLALEEAYRREHRIAEVLQRAILPRLADHLPGCAIATQYQPAWKEAEVGGDFYDLFDLGHGRLGVLIGDVAGKGLLAAVRAAAARYAIRSYAYLDPGPSRVLTFANEVLCKDCPDGGSLMITAFFAVLDTANGILTYANGGHEPPFLRAEGGGVGEMRLHGRALGIFSGYSYPEASQRLEPGDMIVLFTDGITEARRGTDLFGREGISDYLNQSRHADPESVAKGLLEAAQSFAEGALRDDAAIVAFRFDARTDEREHSSAGCSPEAPRVSQPLAEIGMSA
ncbi:MAG: PAS domain S-box protein [Armatimonadetes bacterium]|nr:PAS domain S-box protein [Armatimonadota bacterium]